MGSSSPEYIIFYVIAAISTLASCYVPLSIAKFGKTTLVNKLVFHLHCTLLLQDISSLPYAYVGVSPLCSIAGFIHIYSDLANMLVIVLLTFYYRSLFFEDCAPLVKFIASYYKLIIYGVPLYSLIGFITQSYHAYLDTWCTLVNFVESIALFYVWLWVMLIISASVAATTIYQVQRVDPTLASQVFTGTGFYVFISLLFWMPRTFSIISKNSSPGSYIYTHLIVYVMGILYLFVYLYEKRNLRQQETVEACMAAIDTDMGMGSDSEIGSGSIRGSEYGDSIAVQVTTEGGTGSPGSSLAGGSPRTPGGGHRKKRRSSAHIAAANAATVAVGASAGAGAGAGVEGDASSSVVHNILLEQTQGQQQLPSPL
jgi:hypothetical protein